MICRRCLSKNTLCWIERKLVCPCQSFSCYFCTMLCPVFPFLSPVVFRMRNQHLCVCVCVCASPLFFQVFLSFFVPFGKKRLTQARNVSLALTRVTFLCQCIQWNSNQTQLRMKPDSSVESEIVSRCNKGDSTWQQGKYFWNIMAINWKWTHLQQFFVLSLVLGDFYSVNCVEGWAQSSHEEQKTKNLLCQLHFKPLSVTLWECCWHFDHYVQLCCLSTKKEIFFWEPFGNPGNRPSKWRGWLYNLTRPSRLSALGKNCPNSLQHQCFAWSKEFQLEPNKRQNNMPQ